MPPKSLFPLYSVKDARQLADTIAQHNAGQPMRRLDVFEVLKKSPDSGPSRTLVSASSSYGLTSGGYQAETLSLTSLGERLSVEGDETALVDAVLGVDVFKKFFESYKDGTVPAKVAAKSFLASGGIPGNRVEACWDMVLENGRHVGLIDKMSVGGERVLSREHAIERRFGDGAKGKGSGKLPVPPAEASKIEDPKVPPKPLGIPSLNINLEVHLPADVRPEVYDAIFSSMRKHLIDAE